MSKRRRESFEFEQESKRSKKAKTTTCEEITAQGKKCAQETNIETCPTFCQQHCNEWLSSLVNTHPKIAIFQNGDGKEFQTNITHINLVLGSVPIHCRGTDDELELSLRTTANSKWVYLNLATQYQEFEELLLDEPDEWSSIVCYYISHGYLSHLTITLELPPSIEIPIGSTFSAFANEQGDKMNWIAGAGAEQQQHWEVAREQQPLGAEEKTTVLLLNLQFLSAEESSADDRVDCEKRVGVHYGPEKGEETKKEEEPDRKTKHTRLRCRALDEILQTPFCGVLLTGETYDQYAPSTILRHLASHSSTACFAGTLFVFGAGDFDSKFQVKRAAVSDVAFWTRDCPEDRRFLVVNVDLHLAPFPENYLETKHALLPTADKTWDTRLYAAHQKVAREWYKLWSTRPQDASGHATSAIIDRDKGTIEWFDPVGLNTNYASAVIDALRHYFQQNYQHWTFVEPYAMCPPGTWQEDEGTCALWALLYFYLRMQCVKMSGQQILERMSQSVEQTGRQKSPASLIRRWHCYLWDYIHKHDIFKQSDILTVFRVFRLGSYADVQPWKRSYIFSE